MSRPIFKSNRTKFFDKNNAFKDMLLGHISMDIEIALKTTAGMPVSNTKASGNRRGGGHMKSETRHFRSSAGKFRVEVDKAYAAVQEAGVRLTGKGAPAVMEHYSTPGTSHHFFERAIDTVVSKELQYIRETRKALNL